jgi:hypothetical protein
LTNRKLFLNILTATGISIVLFVFLTLGSYFLNLEYRVNFKIGLPWTFYYQFMIDREIQHGTLPGNFIKDAGITWIFTVFLWIVIKRRNTRHLKKQTQSDTNGR